MELRPADPMYALSDAELALRAGARADLSAASEAFRVLYGRYGGRTLIFLRRLNPSKADDLAQTVWIRVWNALGRDDGFSGDNFRSWVFKIARNASIDSGRRRGVPTLSLEGDGRGDPIDPVDHRAVEGERERLMAERRELLGRCLTSLKPEERSVVEARLLGLDYTEIAGQTALPIKRVYQLYFAAKAKLTSCVEHPRS
jgi:RNA polymerase sigma factor (sigma-70 family)